MGRKKRKQEQLDQAEKLETMAEAAGAMSAYRPYQQEAYNEGMQQQMAQLQPINDILTGMFGGNPNATTAGPEGNLVSPAMMGVGATSKAPGFADVPPAAPAPPELDADGYPIPKGYRNA